MRKLQFCTFIKINCRQTRAIIDTGSCYTCINAYFARKAGIQIIPPNLNEPSVMLGANGAPLEVIGYATAELNISGYMHTAEFTVINNLYHNVILGIEVLREMHAVVDLHRSTLTIADNLLSVPLIRRFSSRNILRTMNRVTILPQHESKIRVRVARNYVLQPSIIEPLVTRHTSGLLVAKAYVEAKTIRSYAK